MKPKITIPRNPLPQKNNKDLFWIYKNVRLAMIEADYSIELIENLETYILYNAESYNDMIKEMRKYVDFDFA